MAIRLARSGEIEAMREIERAAGGLFTLVGMEDVARHEPAAAGVLLEYVDAERAWVSEIEGRAAGYALADVVDGRGHLEQVSVHPEYSRRGLGRELIEVVASWARLQQLPALTLLTFRDVPWNGPYYARLGFRPLPDEELGPELWALRMHERELGLNIGARQAMRRDLDV